MMPRVTIIAAHFNNEPGLKRTLQSVMQQDWGNIEIYVADDHSTVFHQEQIAQFIDERKGSNIQSVKIVRNETNLGTVANIRNATEHMTGDFYITLGGDDTFSEPTVISDMMELFDIFGEDADLVSGQMDRRSADGSKVLPVGLDRGDIAVLCDSTEKLFSRLSHRCIPATVATCYRKGFADKVGGLDTTFRYGEDYHTFLRMARKGILPVFVSRMFTVHPAGGIANGGKTVNRQAVIGYSDDKKVMFKQDVKAYRDRISKEDWALHKKRMQYEKELRMSTKYFHGHSKVDKLKGCILHPIAGIIYVNGCYGKEGGVMAKTADWALCVPMLLMGLIASQLLYGFLPGMVLKTILSWLVLLSSFAFSVRSILKGLMRAWFLMVRSCHPVLHTKAKKPRPAPKRFPGYSIPAMYDEK